VGFNCHVSARPFKPKFLSAPLFTTMDVYVHGKPTRIAFLNETVTIGQYVEMLSVAEGITQRVFEVPWFKHYMPEIIEKHAGVYKKVIENYQLLLPCDNGKDAETGGITAFSAAKRTHKKKI